MPVELEQIWGGRGGVGKEGREVQIVWDPRKDLVAWWPWMILRISLSLQFSYLRTESRLRGLS